MITTYSPSAILQPYVAFFYVLRCKKSDYNGLISEFCLPTGHGHMSFHVQGKVYIEQKSKKHEPLKFNTVGQQTHYYYFKSDSEAVDTCTVTFKPTGLWHLFGVDMPSITDKAIDTTSLFRDKLRKFSEEFNSLQELSTKIMLIENLLINRCLSVQPQLNIIDSAIEMINETYGCCSIKEIISILGISERYFQKKFKKMVGITPGSYKRIVRFNFMFTEIKTNTLVDCKALSALYNYYDFSHFSKDFKKYCGASPSKFHIDQFKFLQELMTSTSQLKAPL